MASKIPVSILIFEKRNGKDLIKYRKQIDALEDIMFREMATRSLPLKVRGDDRRPVKDKDWMGMLLENNGVVILAIAEKHVVGMLHGTDNEFEKCMSVNEIVVLPRFTNRKVGDQLLKQFESFAKKIRKCRYLLLAVHDTNSPALRLYKNHRFKDFKHTMQKAL